MVKENSNPHIGSSGLHEFGASMCPPTAAGGGYMEIHVPLHMLLPQPQMGGYIENHVPSPPKLGGGTY